jgi:hypothetical protein
MIVVDSMQISHSINHDHETAARPRRHGFGQSGINGTGAALSALKRVRERGSRTLT